MSAEVAAQSLTRFLMACAVQDGDAALVELRPLCEGPRGAVGVIFDLAGLITKMGRDQYGDDWLNALSLTHLELELNPGDDTAPDGDD